MVELRSGFLDGHTPRIGLFIRGRGQKGLISLAYILPELRMGENIKVIPSNGGQDLSSHLHGVHADVVMDLFETFQPFLVYCVA